MDNNFKIHGQTFLKILNFCLNDNNYFIFNDNIFTQTYGMPMGNPLSPTIADIVLDKLLDDTFTDLRKLNIKTKILVKYVDDIFAIIKRQDTDTILEHLNKYHNKIQFTIEKEIDETIAFLDLKIHRQSTTIITDWYSKPTASGRMMNYYSTQPQNQKLNTAYNFIKTVFDNSHAQFHNKNYKIITKILNKNNYPPYIIKHLIRKYDNGTTNITTQLTENQNENTSYISVKYIPSLTDNKLLKTIFKNDIKIAHKPNNTLKNIFSKTKTPIHKNLQHNVVYEIPCNGNSDETCGQIYIGTTKRSLETRMTEHKADIRNRRMSTALSQHMMENNHTPDIENVRIIDKENNTNKRYTLESLRIQQKQNISMNTKEDKDKTNYHYYITLTPDKHV